MRTMTKISIVKASLIATLLVTAGISQVANAHDRDFRGYSYDRGYHREVVRDYSYVYYPRQQVYYSPSNSNWFWASGNGWQVGSRLPGSVSINTRLDGVPISLRTAHPYAEHAYVEQTYGRPWRDSRARYIEPRHEGSYGRELSDRHFEGNRDDRGSSGHRDQGWHERR